MDIDEPIMDTGEPIIRSECVKAFVGQLLTDVRQVQLEGSQDAEWQLMLPDGTARLFARVWIQVCRSPSPPPPLVSSKP